MCLKDCMKKICALIACFFAFFTNVKAEKSPEEITFPIHNNPLPTTGDTLRVLLIGNSFTYDLTTYIGDILRKSGINNNTCCVYILYSGGYSILHWLNRYNEKEVFRLIKRGGEYEMDSIGSLQELLHQHWDVVGLQQTSDYSDKIESLSPYLYDMITHIKQDCLNEKVSICWNLSWSYWDGMDRDVPKEKQGWKDIVATTDEMISLYGIDIIIPSGTTIENARSSSLNTAHSLTRDGHHIAYGAGQYLLACTLFETLFKPVYNVSVLNNTFVPLVPKPFMQDSKYEIVSVTEKVAFLCKLCAITAIDDWHVISNVDILASTQPSFIVYPNPVSDSITIENKSFYAGWSENYIVTILIYNKKGQTVLNVEDVISDKISIDISSLKDGQYIMNIIYGEEMSSFPIMKRAK